MRDKLKALYCTASCPIAGLDRASTLLNFRRRKLHRNRKLQQWYLRNGGEYVTIYTALHPKIFEYYYVGVLTVELLKIQVSLNVGIPRPFVGSHRFHVLSQVVERE